MFGTAYFRLRELIRCRRTEVEVVRDVWVKKQDDVRGRLKVEIKVIRK